VQQTRTNPPTSSRSRTAARAAEPPVKPQQGLAPTKSPPIARRCHRNSHAPRRQARAHSLNDAPNTAKASYFAVFCPPPARLELPLCFFCRSVCSLSIVGLPFFPTILLFLLALWSRSLYRLHHALYLCQPNSPFFASLKHPARLDSERYARRRPALQAQSHPVQPTP
jgi:hypothetical protein